MPVDQLMWDIESLDTKPSAVVLSIGAVMFDPNTDELGESIYVVLDVAQQMKAGRTISSDTLAWWNQQSEEARAIFNAPQLLVMDALEALTGFIQRNSPRGFWGNGSDFDNVIIGSLFESFNVPRPWSYSRNRCFRTLKSLPLPKTVIQPDRQGTHHNAIDDARHQARCLQAIARALALEV
jgi:hypothetical protein